MNPTQMIQYLNEVGKNIRNLSHFNEFVRLSCAGSLLDLHIFPNAKEISESMGCFDGVRRYLPVGWNFSDTNIICLSLADGSTPRTAALFAYMSKWQIISVDPAMREDAIERCKSVDRLICIKDIVENIGEYECERAVILAVHAHNSPEKKDKRKNILEAAMKKVKAKNYLVVALPCCNDLNIPGRNFQHEYKDLGIWSEKNVIRIWEI